MRKRVRLDDVISPILLHDECNDSQSFQGLTNGSQRFCVRHRIIIRQGRSAQARKITAIVFCWSVSHNVTTNRRLASAVYYTAFPFSDPHGLKYCARFNAICGAPYLKLTNGLKSLQERTAKTFRVMACACTKSAPIGSTIQERNNSEQNQSRNRHRLKVAACP